MPILTTLDRFGRVVIPKQTRDHFGLEAGSSVTLEDAEDGILLKPSSPETPLALKGGVLVFSGKVSAEASGLPDRVREARIRRFYPKRAR